MNFKERFDWLSSLQKDFDIAELNKEENKPGVWLKANQRGKPIDSFVFRSNLGCEIIIELDKTTIEENKQVWKDLIKPVLVMKGISFEVWTTHSKSLHIHLFFDKKLSNDEKYSWLCEQFGKDLIDEWIKNKTLDDSFFKKERQLIAFECQPHYKSGKPKEMLEEYFVDDKQINHFELKTILEQEKATKAKVELSYWDVLKNKEANEQERVSCIMKLHETHKEWSIEDAFKYVEKHNTWNDFNAKVTLEKMQGVWKYTKKENPIRKNKEIEEKPLNKLNFVSTKEIMSLKKEKGFIIDEMLQQNTVNQLLSPPAHFKSLLALRMAVAVSNGKEFLGFKTKRYPVCYLDKENNKQMLRDRLVGIFQGMGLKRKKFPLFFLLKEGMLDDDRFVEQLSAYIEENKVKLVIFDTLVRFNSGEENSAKDMNKIYQAFIKLQQKTEAAILFLHHTNRAGEFRGSSDLMGQVDTMYSVTRNPKTTQFKLVNTKNRCGEINDITGEIEFLEDGTITVIRNDEIGEEEETNKYDKFSMARAFILDFASSDTTMVGALFERAELMTALDAFNLEQGSGQQISKRLVDKVINYLKKIKILKEGDKRGQYMLNADESEKINKWISPIGEGNALEAPSLHNKEEAGATTSKDGAV